MSVISQCVSIRGQKFLLPFNELARAAIASAFIVSHSIAPFIGAVSASARVVIFGSTQSIHVFLYYYIPFL